MRNFSKIILVDDDPISIFITTEIIESMESNAEVISFQDPLNALKYFRENPAVRKEVLMLDLFMPGIDGFQFLESLKKQGLRQIENGNTDFSVIILTSSNIESDIMKSKKHNVTGYIDKPLLPYKFNQFKDVIFMEKMVES